ncbi:hypothetical protein NMY22_g4855 [Coprinellus aureogranulatus]|nr:hypothetical protein NMY22_g4855 [Coprinellus aureogranulatus]
MPTGRRPAPAAFDWRKREKERVRQQERERKRSQKQIPPWDPAPPPIIPFEDTYGSSDDDDSDYASSNSSEDDTVDVSDPNPYWHPHSAYASPQRSPPKQPSQNWTHAPSQAPPGPSHQAQAYQNPSQSAQAPFVPPTYSTHHQPSQSLYAQPSHPSQAPFVPTQPPQPSSSSHKPSPLNVSHTWHASSYPGMQVAGPAPARSIPTVPHQGFSAIPYHPQGHYVNPLRDIQNLASNSRSQPHQPSSTSLMGPQMAPQAPRKEEKTPEPFIPPDIYYDDYRSRRVQY